MKFVVTGSLGNISKPLVETLVQAGHQVTVISSQHARTAEIEALGAHAAIGSLADRDFLTNTFRGADGVYTMVPPTFAVPDNRAYYNEMAGHYAAAIKASGVKHVVNLSSIGAHLKDGTGPIKGIHDLEQVFNAIDGIGLVHLRPAFFYTNFDSNVDMIKHAGILGANYPADVSLAMVHPADIADAAAAALQNPQEGQLLQYVASDERTPAEIAALLGKAAGKPDLPWVTFTDEQALEGMLQAGLPPEPARNFVEMGTAVRSGVLFEDYQQHRPQLSGRKFSTFAEAFGRHF